MVNSVTGLGSEAYRCSGACGGRLCVCRYYSLSLHSFVCKFLVYLVCSLHALAVVLVSNDSLTSFGKH